jgi:hypothetical protein
LGAWEFGAALDLMDASREVLADRDEIYDRAAVLGLLTPDILQETFEADDDLEASADVARQELDALAAISSAASRLAGEPSVLESIGLMGVDPNADLERARDGFEQGDLPESLEAAASAEALRDDARQVGTERVVLGASGVLGLDGLVLVAVSARSLRRRRRSTAAAAVLPDAEPPA